MRRIFEEKNEPDCRFQKLNSCHPNIKLTIGKISTESLDTEIIRRGCEIEQKVCNKSKKLSVNWSLKIITRNKGKVITGELHRAKIIANDINFEVKRITKSFCQLVFLEIL